MFGLYQSKKAGGLNRHGGLLCRPCSFPRQHVERIDGAGQQLTLSLVVLGRTPITAFDKEPVFDLLSMGALCVTSGHIRSHPSKQAWGLLNCRFSGSGPPDSGQDRWCSVDHWAVSFRDSGLISENKESLISFFEWAGRITLLKYHHCATAILILALGWDWERGHLTISPRTWGYAALVELLAIYTFVSSMSPKA